MGLGSVARVEARRFMQRHVALEIFLAAQVRDQGRVNGTCHGYGT